MHTAEIWDHDGFMDHEGYASVSVEAHKVYTSTDVWFISESMSLDDHDPVPATVYRLIRYPSSHWWQEVDGYERDLCLACYYNGRLAQGYKRIGNCYEWL